MFHNFFRGFRRFALRLQASFIILFTSTALVAYPRKRHGREDFMVLTLPHFQIYHLGYAQYTIGKMLESQLLLAEAQMRQEAQAEEEAIAEKEYVLNLEAEAAVNSIKKILAED
jgi:hypothetical protein